jgi:hypothetical protein
MSMDSGDQVAGRDQGMPLVAKCDICQVPVATRLLAAVNDLGDEGEPVRRSFVTCGVCGRAMVLEQPLNTHKWNGDPWVIGDLPLPDLEDGPPDEPLRVYPATRHRGGFGIPDAILKSLREAETCFQSNAFTACSIMCRKALEGMCEHLGVRERTLGRSLKELRNIGSIDENLYAWADALRVIGNEAAHDSRWSAQRQDAQDVLDFTEAILVYIFVYRHRFTEFTRRRENADLIDAPGADLGSPE